MGQFLQCDAAGCDHREDVDEYGPHLIGTPCPKCGADMLTQQDFDDFEPLRVMIETLKKMGLASDDSDGVQSPVSLSLHQHAGTMTAKFEPITPEGE